MPKSKQISTDYRPYKLPIDYPVLLLTDDRWHLADSKSGRLHFHNCLEIGICTNGNGIMKLESKSCEYHTGDISCVPKNIPHMTYSDNDTQSQWNYIYLETDELFRGMVQSGTMLTELSVFNISSFQFILPEITYPKIHFLTTTIVDELKSKPLHYQHTVTSLLFSLCVEICRMQPSDQSIPLLANNVSQTPKAHNTKLAIAPALDYIDQNYMKQFSVVELAATCHLSETHFRRIFQSTMGTSPMDYLNNIRIQKACVLLKTTKESVLYISEYVGFRSISSFNRSFLKKMGTQPREWREQVLFSEGKAERGMDIKYTDWL